METMHLGLQSYTFNPYFSHGSYTTEVEIKYVWLQVYGTVHL